jgi:1-aminocyclopropane-1-carboxylate deaminase/D-cysteine desulfhydrase-like pyridoxal-dependent ACC family enzyme
MIQLLKDFPLLKEKIPYVSLGEFPTPAEKLENLGERIGVRDLYIKRDDLSGNIYGGNKIRKLEFLLGEALQSGAKEVMTFGAAGSNHALATAVYADKVGLRSISMLMPQPNARYIRKNLLMSYHCNAELHYFPDKNSLNTGMKRQLTLHKKKYGCSPEIIPFGGTSPLGTVGFVNAAFELKEQIRQGKIPEPDRIYIALGSMGSAAGLLLGLRAAQLTSRLIPVMVVPEAVTNERNFIDLFRKTNDFLHTSDPSFPIIELSEEEIGIKKGFFGQNYALFTQEGIEALRLMEKTEDIKLDGTYTGKTFAALLSDAEKENLNGKTIMFWNTLNSRDFSDAIRDIDYHRLPRVFHRYFEEGLQPLDHVESNDPVNS